MATFKPLLTFHFTLYVNHFMFTLVKYDLHQPLYITHSLTISLTHSFTISLTHSLTHSLNHSLTHTFSYTSSCSLRYSSYFPPATSTTSATTPPTPPPPPGPQPPPPALGPGPGGQGSQGWETSLYTQYWAGSPNKLYTVSTILSILFPPCTHCTL